MDIQVVPSVLNILFLIYFSFSDIKYHNINKTMVHVYILIGAVYSLFSFNALVIVVSLIPGLFFLLLSYISEEKIGYGDGMIIIGIAFWTPFIQIIFIIETAFVLLFLVTGVIFVLCRNNKLKEIPFIPFLLIGTVVNIYT